MKKQIWRFLLRWLANFVGLLLVIITGIISSEPSWWALLFGAFLLGLLNAVLKPLMVILTLPAIALSLGFFLIIINGTIFYIAGKLYSPLEADSFWSAILAGLVIGLVNYILALLLEVKFKERV